jgi:hypothetical protein
MKSTHMVFENGVHVANQLAKTAERACVLYASKTGKNWRDLTAIEFVSSNPAKVEAARIKSIKPITEEQPHERL